MIAYDDVRTLTADRIAADCGRLPSVIVGSPPCQDASTANTRGRGVDGERTGLFFDAIRIVGECRPVWCVFENVPGIRTRGADRVLGALEALGYTCWPLVVGAWHAGAPHRRNRVWIVAADTDAAGRRSWSGSDIAQPELANDGERLVADAAGGAGAEIASGVEPDDEPWTAWCRSFVGSSGWNGGADGLARSLRVASRIRAGLASFGSIGEFRECLTRESRKHQRVASGAGQCSSGDGLMDALRIMASLPDESFAHFIAQTTGSNPETVGMQGGISPHPVKSALPINGLKYTTSTATGRTIGQTTCKPSAAIATSPTTCGHVPEGNIQLGEREFNRLARACISAYGDAVVPQITEAIGRVMMRLLPTNGTVLDLFSGAAGGWSLGLHRAGYKTLAFCEIDPWRRAALFRVGT